MAYATQWGQRYPDGGVIERDLTQTDLPFVALPWISAANGDAIAHNAEQSAALAVGNAFIDELRNAEHWLITTPMYNFAVPARLKAYIDHIVRVGVTFKTHEDGSFTGLLEGKKATVIVSSAGEYTPGSPIEAYDHVGSYLKSILSVIGVTDVTIVQAGATWKVDHGLIDLETYVADFSGQHLLLASK
jgi:FMN-dependent NADH-azoreductase